MPKEGVRQAIDIARQTGHRRKTAHHQKQWENGQIDIGQELDGFGTERIQRGIVAGDEDRTD